MVRKQITVKIEESVIQQLDREADRFGLDRSDVIRLKLNATLTLAQVPASSVIP
jgi:antitoxin component of RelBE/YafQ-DinJ toxin-antitoxin module